MTETPRTSTVERPAVDGGPPSADDRPRRPALSPSRAADFKQCPLLYRFRAIDRLPERTSLAQMRGTLVHAVLERLHGLPAVERLPAAAHGLVEPTWAELCEAEPALLAGLRGAAAQAPGGSAVDTGGAHGTGSRDSTGSANGTGDGEGNSGNPDGDRRGEGNGTGGLSGDGRVQRDATGGGPGGIRPGESHGTGENGPAGPGGEGNGTGGPSGDGRVQRDATGSGTGGIGPGESDGTGENGPAGRGGERDCTGGGDGLAGDPGDETRGGSHDTGGDTGGTEADRGSGLDPHGAGDASGEGGAPAGDRHSEGAGGDGVGGGSGEGHRTGVADGVGALLDGAHALLDAYFTLEDPRRVEPEARELLVEVELDPGLLLRGYIDRIDVLAPDDPQGPRSVRVVDYKTGSAPRPTAEARALFQMKFYALVLLLLRGRAPEELRLIYLTRPEQLSYVPDEVQLRRFGRTLAAVWAAIRAASASGDFRPNPGPACAWCDHRARCPAWGGTPPPYPGPPAEDAAGPDDADP